MQLKTEPTVDLNESPLPRSPNRGLRPNRPLLRLSSTVETFARFSASSRTV